MKKTDIIQEQIEKLCEHTGDSILVSLLLIRQLWHSNASSALLLTNSNSKAMGDTLWDIVCNNQEGNYNT